MSAMTSEVKAADARLTRHRNDAVHTKVQLTESLSALKAAQSRLLAKRLDETITEQRSVEQEALAYSKNVNRLNQRAAKWKTEQKRFRFALEGLDHFAAWAAATENDLHTISRNLEHLYAVLEKEQANGGYTRAQEST